ncbi:MAG TPA: hypothetical protein VE733_27975, partial [Streptosporangiaceae bacterium]|nr:hypothetical protein [Streptosporangiaceae bacterium]
MAAAGAGVLMTSALALPGGMATVSAGDPLPDGTGAAKAGPSVSEQAYWDEAGYLSISGLLHALPPVTPGSLGATGALPRNSKPSPALLHNARNLAKLAASLKPGGLQSRSGRNAIAALAGIPGALAALPPGPLGIPGIMLAAYQRAQQILASQQPGCHLPWWLLAGIGQVESGQADGGLVDAQGTTLVPILGPVLDGTNGTAAIPMGGRWERAIGPMQFLPSTWIIWGGGGNPNNVYDAALAAGRYLCAGGRNLSSPAQQVAAVFSYNYSDSYVQQVLTWAYAYRGGVHPLPPRKLPPSRRKPAAHHSPARPSHRPAPAAGSSPSGKPTTTSPPHPRSSSPVSPPPSPRTTPPAPPSPSPTSASPAPSPAPPPPPPPPSPSPTPSPTAPAT